MDDIFPEATDQNKTDKEILELSYFRSTLWEAANEETPELILNGQRFSLVDQKEAKQGDLCIEIETMQLFICGKNMCYEDHMLDIFGDIVNTNCDPHQIYKVLL
jgi:hypothetical protein